MPLLRFSLLLFAIILASTLLSLILNKFFKKNIIMKYIPAFLAGIISLYYFYLSKTVHTGFQDIAYIIIAIMFLTGCVTMLASALIIDFVLRKKK